MRKRRPTARATRRPVVVVPRSKPVVVAPRRGPGLLETMARTAVIAGTATAVSRGVHGAMNSAAQQRADVDAYHQQQEEMAQQAQIEAALLQQEVSPPADFMSRLQQLAQMKEAGLLTDEEFAAAKNKLLAD